MKVLVNPTEQELAVALTRPALETENLENLIKEVFDAVNKNGDTALRTFAEKFDRVSLSDLQVSELEFVEAESLISEELKAAIRTTAGNIERFHRSQELRETEVETTAGVLCWRKAVPVERVGLYIPGGTAPLFSTVLMLGIPAAIAGCPTRILCSPPNSEGKIHPAILYAAKVAGIQTVFKVGGSQAIAAMTIGTESVPKVDKLFGPGNQYVTAAKVYAQRLGVAIDMPAGPSEVLVAADAIVPAAFVAADLLAQAEHGSDSQVVFVTDNEVYVKQVQEEVKTQLEQLPRAEIASKALENSTVIVCSPKVWCSIINAYAPEHLIAMGTYEEMIVEGTVNAGSVFIGANTAESFGDYASGTNHTLPTAGYARSYSGVSLDSFVKKITYQRVSNEGLKNLGNVVVTMAEAEELQAHANAIKVRLSGLDTLSKSFRALDLTNESNSMQSQTLDLTCETKVSSSSCSVTEGVSRTALVERFIRRDFRDIVPYSSARDECEGLGGVFLDANENGLLNAFNRYPDPLQKELKKAISAVKGFNAKNLFLGNGSDEVLDLIYRLTTTPFLDEVAYLNPSYGMYSVLAKLNGVRTRSINLNEDFTCSVADILLQSEGCKLLIICNPNNPTGGVLSKEELEEITTGFGGVVVVDEAYVDFCQELSLANSVEQYDNLIVVQTLSKAYGMAGLRIGMAIASEQWIAALNTVKPPYNLSSVVQETAIQRLNSENWKEVTATIASERERVTQFLKTLSTVSEVFPSEANFILFRIQNATKVYDQLLAEGVVVRNRSSQFNCSDTLRVSIGNIEENNRFIKVMQGL